MFNYIHKNKIKSEIEKARLDEAKRVNSQCDKKIEYIIKDMEEQAEIIRAGYESKYNILLKEIDKLNKDMKNSQDAYRNYRSEVAKTAILADELEVIADSIREDSTRMYQVILRSQNIIESIIRVFKSNDKKNSEKLKVIGYNDGHK